MKSPLSHCGQDARRDPRPWVGQSMLGALLLVSFLMWLVGCTGGGGRPTEKTYPVSGTVTLDGQPLAEGEIYFKDTTKGDVAFGQIKDGKFAFQAPAGPKKVEIYAYKMELDPVAKEMYGDQAQPTKVNYIPAKFNTDSTLTATVEASTEPGKNTFEFKITSD